MKVKIGNIRGPQGPEGPEGPEGKQGPTGATGATGQVDASTPISFEENSSYVNIESGESIATIFGKCKKILGGILTGAGSTLLGADLTAGRVLLSNSSGKITASNITDTELGYLDGLTGNVQTSLNSLTEKNDALHFPLTKLSTTDGINVYYARYGKIVEIVATGNFSKAETIQSGTGLVLGTLPPGFRPAATRFFGLGFLYANLSHLALNVDDKGLVSMITTSADINISNNRYCNFCVHFMIS